MFRHYFSFYRKIKKIELQLRKLIFLNFTLKSFFGISDIFYNYVVRVKLKLIVYNF